MTSTFAMKTLFSNFIDSKTVAVFYSKTFLEGSHSHGDYMDAKYQI